MRRMLFAGEIIPAVKQAHLLEFPLLHSLQDFLIPVGF
jgi:hypothetical protein